MKISLISLISSLSIKLYLHPLVYIKTVYNFAFCIATFSLQNITGLDVGLDLMGKSRLLSISISANHIREFASHIIIPIIMHCIVLEDSTFQFI